MDYEKLYKEANKKVAVRFGSNVAKELFPDLYESEDERIRQKLIDYCDCSHVTDTFNGIPWENVRAWLEKQAEQEPTKVPKFKIGDYVKNVNDKREPIYEIVYMDNECYICEYRGKEMMGDKAVMHFSFDNPYLRLVQKPADKVEPKFKVGDWVIDKQGIVHQIANVIENVTCHTYGYDIVGGGYFNDNTEGVRLWTIRDAKDGDVLVASDDSIFLFKDRVYSACKYYVALTTDGAFKFNEGLEHFWETSRAVHPATKEQCDLLFQKMHEAGYEWDAEKKELKKIEQNPTQEVKPFEAEHGKYYYCIKDYFCGGRKQASKGDVVQALRGLPIMGLKDASEYFLPVNFIKCYSTWSEEDEYIIEEIEAIIDAYVLEENNPKALIDWLKSLRPQNTWRPSGAQMKALEYYIEKDIIDKEGVFGKYIFELYAQLKKLK